MIHKLIEKLKAYGVKETLFLLRRRIHRETESIMERAVLFFFRRSGLLDVIILESHNDFDSNGGAVYDYLIENEFNRKYRIVWMLRNNPPKTLPENVYAYRMDRLSVRKTYYRCRAKYILCSHVMFESLRKDQISVYMTHGAVALKNVKGKVYFPERVTYCLYPSQYLAEIFSGQMMLPHPNEKMLFLGYPSHDILYKDIPGDLRKITTEAYHKMVLWMPTFRASVDKARNDSDRELPMGIPVIQTQAEYEELNDWLAQRNMLLVIKIHPMQDLSRIRIQSCSHILVLDGMSVKRLGVENYRLMKDADALISDYSSVATDYLHLDRPIAYTLDDAQDYKIGFIVDDPAELMAGDSIKTMGDMKAFLEAVHDERDEYRSARNSLIKKIFEYQDGNSCQRLIEFLNLRK